MADSPKGQRRNYLSVVLKGMAMGAADVVPGVSGGTVAFITGIYQELINSLKSIEPGLLALLFQRGPAAVWQAINGNFLLALFSGVLFSVFTLAKAISYSLQHYPILVWSFFFGLIAASALLLFKQLERKSTVELLCAGIGVITAFFISSISPGQLEGSYLNLFLAGLVAICAMILPGVSGAFLLLMMGLYSTVIDAIKGLDIASIACFGAGAGMGLLLFSHVLGWLFERFYSQTLALLTGFLIGSLSMVWPWKQTLSTRLNSHGQEVPLIQENILPWDYQTLVGQPSYLLLALLMIGLGVCLVLGLEYTGSTRLKKDSDL